MSVRKAAKDGVRGVRGGHGPGRGGPGVGQVCTEKGKEQEWGSMTTDMTQIVRCFSIF